MSDNLPPLPDHWIPLGFIGTNASFQRTAREYAEDYARAAIEASRAAVPAGWITDWLCPDGTTKPVYSPGSHKPNYGAELNASLNVYPVYATPITQAKPEQAAQPLTHEHVRAVGGIVHGDGNIFFTNIEKLNAAVEAAKPA